MAKTNPLDDPEKRRKVVRLLLILSPFSFALCFFLALVQGAEPRHCLLIGAIGGAVCLVAAPVIHVMGSKSWIALAVVQLALMLALRK